MAGASSAGPLYYSNHPEEGLLYLYDAAWIDGDGSMSISIRTASS